MDEVRLLALISEPEGRKIDFKRELDLDTRRGKAELIKDIVAIANSGLEEGYLIIGVDDSKQIVGVAFLDEERIQQIADAYIKPPVRLSCELVPLLAAGFLSVGVITISTADRPHRVAKAIARIDQGEVFVRRGSTTASASTEERIRMREDAVKPVRDSRQYVRAAETHLKLGNYENAVASLTRAIEITPTAELFIARAEAYRQLQKNHPHSGPWWEWGEAALKDLADGIALSDSPEVEKRARRMRRGFLGFAYTNYTSEQRDEDFEYELSLLEGEERGKWICEQVWEWDVEEHSSDYTVSLLLEAIESEYREPEVYYLLANAHSGCGNYGLALDEINRLIASVGERHPDLVEYLCFKARKLAQLNRFEEAHEVLLRAKQIDPTEFEQHVWLGRLSAEDILCRYGLAADSGIKIQWPMLRIVRLLILELGRRLDGLTMSEDGKQIVSWATGLSYVESKCPGILNALREILGEDEWKTLQAGSPELVTSLTFPSIPQQIQDMRENGIYVVYNNERVYIVGLPLP